MVGTLKFMVSGIGGKAVDVNDVSGFVGTNLIINGLNNLKQDMTSGKTRTTDDNLILDDLSADTADVATNWTYDGANDKYTTDTGVTSCTLEFHALSTTNTKTVIAYCDLTLAGTSSVVYSVSVDGGSVYTAVTNGEIKEITTESNDVRLKIVVTKLSATVDELLGFGILRSAS